MGASKVLGIVGICISWFSLAVADIIPLPTIICMSGVILGIVGLSIKKEKGKERRDKILNRISIIEAVVLYLLWLNWRVWVNSF